MKIRIDTELKEIEIENKVNLDEFFNKINILLPNGLWKEYSLKTFFHTINWVNPVIIRDYPLITPKIPFWQQPITISYMGDKKLAPDMTISQYVSSTSYNLEV